MSMISRTILSAIYSRIVQEPQERRIYYVCDKRDWATKDDAQNITSQIRAEGVIDAQLATNIKGIVHNIVHFGSLPLTAKGLKDPWSQHNQLISTVFHGDFGMKEPAIEKNLEIFLKNTERLSCVVASCNIMAKRLAKWGVPSSKLKVIPLGVEVQKCIEVQRESRESLRRRYGIQHDDFCIGSWQKDGEGWQEGLRPKVIKGPDVLVETLSAVQKRGANIVALLTGPARGYVKNELNKRGVRFIHTQFDKRDELLSFMRAADMCIVTSREEGGPKAILESMALKVPVVSTAVGMAPDIIVDGANGLLQPIGDIEGLARATLSVYEDRDLAASRATAAFDTIQKYDWQIIAQRYAGEVYLPLLNSSNALKRLTP